jgi:general secretion pathway protein A
LPSATHEPSVRAVSLPDVIDLRDEGPRAIDGFADEPAPVRQAAAWPHTPSSTLTYERHYGLREKPFSLSTDSRFLYRSASHAPVLNDLRAAIRRREGLIVLTGDIGTGKTTLCRAVLGQLDRKTFATFVPDPFVSREDLLKTMLVDFGVMSGDDLVKGRLKGASRLDLSYPLYEFLQGLEPLDAFAVLVLDEAQNLSLPLLEEVRILSDLEVGRKLLQVVLVGQPELDEYLRLPRMRQVAQRVSVHRELKPLDREGLSGYVAHRLQMAGGASSQLRIAEEALDEVFAASGGVPRVVNLVCDKALAHGERAGTFLIGAELVRAGLAELRLAAPTTALPAPAPAPVLQVPAPSPPAFVPAVQAPAPEAGHAGERRTIVAPVQSAAGQGSKPDSNLDVKPAARPDVQPAQALTPNISAPAPMTSGIDALMDLPAVDLKVRLGEDPDRTTRRSPPLKSPVTRRKVWRGAPRLGPVAISMLIVLGATTGVSMVGYWLWLRPLLSEPGGLPHVESPLAVQTTRQQTQVSAAGSAAAQPAASVPREVSTAVAPSQALPVASGTWAIQTGVFSGPKRASVLESQLTELGYPAFQRDIAFVGKGTLRVVLVGPFASQEDAEGVLPRLRAMPGFEHSMSRRLPPQ